MVVTQLFHELATSVKVVGTEWNEMTNRCCIGERNSNVSDDGICERDCWGL